MTPEELKQQLIEAQNQALSEYRRQNEALLSGKLGPAEMKAYEDKINVRLDELGKAIAKLSAPAAPATTPDLKAETKAWFDGFRKKLLGQPMTEVETKTMTVGDPTTGGYLAPVEFVNELLKDEVLYSPIRSLARVRTTSNRSVQQPKKTSDASASWVTEIGTRAETTNPKIGLEEIPTHEMFALAKISKQDLEDTAFDLQGFLREEFAEQFGVLEGTAFISGNAVGKPEGILSNSSVTGFTGVTTSAKVVADDLINLLYSLSETDARGATFIWRRAVTLAISLLKNSTTNEYLWKPGFQVQGVPNLLGCPWVECPDMPAEGSSAKAVAVGNFRRGYVIVDRLAIEIMVDPYTSKSTGCIEISARKRVGGQVVMPSAIKVYTLKA